MNLLFNKVHLLMFLVICLCVSSCSNIFPDVKVWLVNLNFEVDVKANNGRPFVCHIVVPYSDDLYNRLAGMKASDYFTNSAALKREYKDSIDVVSYDMIPGKNMLDQKLKIKSYTKAKAAFLFARYDNSGVFMENVSSSPSIVVRFLQYKFEVINAMSLDELTKKVRS